MPEGAACEECAHGRFQADKAKLSCDACPIGTFPHSSKVACSAHNTEEHICREKRHCVATLANALKKVPAPCNKKQDPTCEATWFWPHNNINSFDDWCNYQCASTPDRWEKSFCPNADGTPKAGALCNCYEKRSVTQTGKPGDDMLDKQCNDHQVCSHVTCKIENHMCPAHKKFKMWAADLGIVVGSQAHKVSVHVSPSGDRETFSSNCDDGGQHKSIRVFHFGREETTCKHGHFCYVKGDKCVCVQRTATRPDADRCWYDVKTPTSVMACYRLCKKSEAEGTRDAQACESSKDYVDSKAPVLTLCQPTALAVTDAKWDLCEASAMDQIDGDVTKSIKYTIVRLGTGEDDAPEYLARDAPFGVAKARFRKMGADNVVLGALINGNYLISLKVSDAAGNEVEADEEVSINVAPAAV